MGLYLARAGPVSGCEVFSCDEVAAVVHSMKSGKSTGADGIPYEHLQVVLGSELRDHFIDLLNDILVGKVELPDSWKLSHVVFLPKTRSPSQPKDLRPIVLSSVVCKVFTRLLLQRLRPKFPALASGQIIGEAGAQTLDAALAVQHAIRLSEERKQPLVVAQIDIAEASDTVSHEAVANFLASLGPSREGHLLLRLVLEARVQLQLTGVMWTQKLERGIVQGAPYSALPCCGISRPVADGGRDMAAYACVCSLHEYVCR